MSTQLYFLPVGAGNMTLIRAADGTNILYDCNVTDRNRTRISRMLSKILGPHDIIDVFICSHRDADHFRGVDWIDEFFGILKVWDSGISLKHKVSPEHQAYRKVRNGAIYTKLVGGNVFEFGETALEVIFAGHRNLPKDSNTQSVVLKVSHRDSSNRNFGSAILAGDTNCRTWRDGIMRKLMLEEYAYKVSNAREYRRIQAQIKEKLNRNQYRFEEYNETVLKLRRYFRSKYIKFKRKLYESLRAEVLLAPRHGSRAFFGDSDVEVRICPYTKHVRAIKPSLTVFSTDGKSYGHPDPKAVKLYSEHTRGTRKGRKVWRTDSDGKLTVNLKTGLLE